MLAALERHERHSCRVAGLLHRGGRLLAPPAAAAEAEARRTAQADETREARVQQPLAALLVQRAALRAVWRGARGVRAVEHQQRSDQHHQQEAREAENQQHLQRTEYRIRIQYVDCKSSSSVLSLRLVVSLRSILYITLL